MSYVTTVNRLRVEKTTFNLIQEMCHLSKNLFNATLYATRQHYFSTNQFLKYEQAYHELKVNENYQLLPSQVAQQTMKVVERCMRSFFGLVRERKAGNYNRPVHLPHYLEKDGLFVLIFTPAHFRFKNDGQEVKLTVQKELLQKHGLSELRLTIPNHLVGKTIKEIRINPKSNFFQAEFVSLDEQEYKKIEPSENTMSIDFGINNLITAIDNQTTKPIIIDGREIKSINQWFNKQLAKYQSIAKIANDKYETKRIRNIRFKRNNRIKDAFHKIANYIITRCVENNISTIVVGYNKEWKQHLELGSRNNQNFVQLPYGKLISYLEYKAQRHGVSVVLQEESYTSKCDALALESVQKHEVYLGKRKYRGLFASSIGKFINADVNGAINIMRKNKGSDKVIESWIQSLVSSGFVYNPKRVKLANLC